MLLHLKAGDGDLLLITEPALLKDLHNIRSFCLIAMYCLCDFISINYAALIDIIYLILRYRKIPTLSN